MNQKMKELTDLITVGDDEYREGDVFLNVDKVWQWHCEQMREALEKAVDWYVGEYSVTDKEVEDYRNDLFKDFGVEDNEPER